MIDKTYKLPIEETEAQKSMRMAEIEKFANIIKGKRKDAINARKSSGIEKVWQEDEEAYEGIDQYNRPHGAYTKSRTGDGPLMAEKKAPAGRCKDIPNITRPYCDAASARVADMLLPTDDRNWALRPTPEPTLVMALEDMSPAIDGSGQAIMRQVPTQAAPVQKTGMMSRIAGAIGIGQPQPQQQELVSVTVAEMAQKSIDEAKKRAERAQSVIEDYLVECKYHAEVRKVIENAAIFGVGILKGPHPSRKKSRSASKTPDGWSLKIELKVTPTSISIDPRNFYPDGNCGEDHQKGAYVFERDDLTAKALRELKGGDYIDEMIDLCLDEGPISPVEGVKKLGDGEKVSDNDLFDVWYFHGEVSQKDMRSAGCECDMESAPCVVTMVNDRIIKITMSPLDSGEFPYDVFVWQKRANSWAGIGVARQIRTCQTRLTASVRRLEDNATLTSGPQVIFDSSKIEPADGNPLLTPWKLWRKKFKAEDMTDVRNAFTIINIETRQVELLNLVNYWTKTAEDVTGLPMLLQGQQGAASNTATEINITNNNGSTVLRRIARTFDDRITEPHIGRYYEWVLLHGPEDAKGDFQIDARGSSALVERELQNRFVMQLIGIAPNPIYGVDPARVMKEALKGARIDPKSVEYDEEQKKEMANRQPPEDPRITAAKIMVESKGQSEQLKVQEAADHAAAQASLEMQRQQFEAQEAEKDRRLQQMLAEIDAQLASQQLSSEERRDLEKQKVLLADVTMRLKVQERMADKTLAHQRDVTVAGHASDLYKHNNPQVASPAVEPTGKAKKGEEFTG